MLKFIRLFPLLLISIGAFSQSKTADSLYDAKNYLQAGRYYLKSAAENDFIAAKKGYYYNAACCYSLAEKTDSAIVLLKKAIASGYKNIEQIKKDTDFSALHHLPQWEQVLKSIRTGSTETGNPEKVKLVTSDIHNYWKAYDLAQKDTADRLNIFRKYYVDKGSDGMQDYFATKVWTMKGFIKSQDSKPKFYAAIRKNTYLVDSQKPMMIESFRKFKQIFPGASFPAIYFVIGSFNSGGTVSDAGLLIGLDQSAGSADIPLDELNLWQRNNLGKVSGMPYLIAHELIHFNQKGMAKDTTLLKSVLVEGMADFIGELISGRNPNERLHVWAKGKEQQIWSDFRKEMYLNRARNWIGNGSQETAEKPADLGYWIGYQICKAYYDKSTDKNQAVNDMLNIKDYKAFYEQSGAAQL
jgi:tetratricopeptide (TPR) repeat protein